jgi:hypothetical protein
MLSDYEREEDDDTNEGGFASSPLRRRLRVEKNVASQKIDFGLQQVKYSSYDDTPYLIYAK